MVSDLNFNIHIKIITQSANYHFMNISRIKGLMSQQDLEKLVHAFIFSRPLLKVDQTAAADSERITSV